MTTLGNQQTADDAPRRRPPCDLRRHATSRRRLGLESLESRELLAATTVHYRLEAQDASGNVIASVAAGSDFQLAVFVQDTRSPPAANAQGVFAGFLNVAYTASLASVPVGAGLSYGPLFDVARLGNTGTAGQIVGAGAARSTDTPPGSGEQLLWKLPLHAVDPGSLSFVASFDAVGGHDTLLYGSDLPVAQADILFDTLNLPVTGSVQPSLFIADASISEGNNPSVDTPLLFTVTLVNANNQTVTVAYATSDLSAVAPGDYATTSGTLSFTPGTTRQFITVGVHGDSTAESDETFRITLSAANHANLGAATGTGTIINDDASPAAVAGRWLFYNQSTWDGNNAAVGAADDAAIATDKTAYLPNGSLATFTNVSSYSRGINGIMIDLAGSGSHASISANDFAFKVGNDNALGSWTEAPAPTTVVVRAGQGTAGSDRIEITWANNAIKNQWLEVQVLANARTGLTAADVFFWGNKVGDVGTGTPAGLFLTSAADKTTVLGNNAGGVAVTNVRDFNRDGNVTAADATIVLGNQGTIVRLQIDAGGQMAPLAGDAGVAFTLAGTTGALPLATTPDQVTITTSTPAASPAIGARARAATMAESAQLRANQEPYRTGSTADAMDGVWLDDDLLALLARSCGQRSAR